jgi:hypothetical protein
MDTIKSLLKRITTGRSTQAPTAPDQAPRNYTQERETTRTGALSAEDQEWEADRRQRDQTVHESGPPPPGSSQ